MSFIKSIPIGNLYSVYSTLCDGLDEDEKVFGCYSSLKDLLVSLAEFYLSVHSGHTLAWFGKEYTFYVNLGGDGAPFGKDDTACAWLVGFLNIGRGILSSNKNHLLFGANCSENCIRVKRYIKLLLADIQSIEQTVFPCKYNGHEGEVTINVEFRIAELPNDMKMIAFLSEELGNSATFFSFANVCNGTFGEKANNTWHSWEYSVRLSVVKKVDVLKETLSRQKLAQHTKRSKITALIAKLKSRQEFVPPLGPIIDHIHIEPLHLKNNACALAHRYLLDEGYCPFLCLKFSQKIFRACIEFTFGQICDYHENQMPTFQTWKKNCKMV